jgi:hypothetical protein
MVFACLLVKLARYDEFQVGRGIRHDDGGVMSLQTCILDLCICLLATLN